MWNKEELSELYEVLEVAHGDVVMSRKVIFKWDIKKAKKMLMMIKSMKDQNVVWWMHQKSEGKSYKYMKYDCHSNCGTQIILAGCMQRVLVQD